MGRHRPMGRADGASDQQAVVTSPSGESRAGTSVGGCIGRCIHARILRITAGLGRKVSSFRFLRAPWAAEYIDLVDAAQELGPGLVLAALVRLLGGHFPRLGLVTR